MASFFSKHGPALAIGAVILVVALLVYGEVRGLSGRVDEVVQSNSQLREQLDSVQTQIRFRPAFRPREGPPQYEPPPPQEPGVALPPPSGPRGGGPVGDWPECTGSIPEEEVDIILEENDEAFQRCYLSRLDDEPELAGEAVVALKVDARGRMIEAQVSGSLRDDALFECLLQLVANLNFGEIEDGQCAVVELPLRFDPQ